MSVVATALSSGARSTRSSSENESGSSVKGVESTRKLCCLTASPAVNGMNFFGTRSDARSELERDRTRLVLGGSISSEHECSRRKRDVWKVTSETYRC